jgi:peptidoglycan/xylan/chitin deacetylase (PgdA/CDA1 family)
VTRFDALDARRDARVPQVIFSFDDGYRDFVDYAVPILADLGVSANYNVIVESVETGRPPWITRVVDALNCASSERVSGLKVPGFSNRLIGADDQSKERYGTALTAYLKFLTRSERAQVCDDLESLLEETDPSCFTAMMSHAEVAAMADVHELGAHSYSHDAMSCLTDEEFDEDIERCLGYFAKLGEAMKIFAFPYGAYRTGQVDSLLAAGVGHVLLVGERPARMGAGVYERITMYGDSDEELSLRAMGHRAEWTRAVVRRLRR